MELKTLTPDSLILKLKALVTEERRLTLEILRFLREVESRRLYAERGFSSLHEFCVKELGLSSGSAFRRIESMRLLRELPEVERKIQEGSLNLTTVSAARVFFQREKQERKREYSIAEKGRLLESFSGKSTREVEKALVTLSPESVPKDRIRELTDEKTEIKFIADRELMALIEQVKDSMGGKNAFPDYATVLKVLAKEYLKKKRSDLNVSGTPLEESSPEAREGHSSPGFSGRAEAPAPGPSRYIPAKLRRRVIESAGHRCEYRDPTTAKRCESKRAIEIDHMRPFAQGGSSERGNLRALCHSHNAFKAIEAYGTAKMSPYLRL